MPKPKQPRRPSDKERHELIDFLDIENTYDVRDNADIEDLSIAEYVDTAYIAVFDNFVSTCPGYTGKVMCVIWEPGPECYEVYGWRNAQLTRMAQDAPFAA